MDVELALKINRLVHDECKDVPHDIGIRIESLVRSHQSDVKKGDSLDYTNEDKCVCEHKSVYKKVRFGVRLTKCRKCRQILSREQIWFNDK